MNLVKMYVMGNDAKWVVNEKELSFVPFVGMDFENLAGEQPLRVSGMSYDGKDQFFKLRLNWLSAEPLTSQQLYDLEVGWKEAVK